MFSAFRRQICRSCAFPGQANADYSSFEIDNYNVRINVLKDSTIEVTETLDVNFNQERHGIYRDIPLKGTLKREVNGKLVKSNYTIEIYDVFVLDEPFAEYRDGDSYIIKIGDEDQLLTGKQTYTISYKILMDDCSDDSFDEIYVDLIGSDWDTVIHHADITVTMPFEFDENSVNITSGLVGSASNIYTEYIIADNSIYITTTKELSSNAGVSLRIELEEGYFNYSESEPAKFSLSDIDFEYYIMFFSVVLMFIIWFNFGKTPKMNINTYTLPPKNMTPAEVGYIFDGRVDDKDVISLLFFWAVNGYIAIKKLKLNNYEIKRLVKNPVFENEYEKDFFHALFDSGIKNVPSRKKTNTFHLRYRFSEITNKAKRQIINKYNLIHGGIFTKSSVIIKNITLALCASPYLLSVFRVSQVSEEFIKILIATYLGASIFLYFGFKHLNEMFISKIKSKSTRKILNSILFPVYIAVPFYFMYKTMYKFTYDSVFIYGVLVTIFLIGLLAGNMEKPTEKTIELRENILGFRKFMKNATTDEIKTMAYENQYYFYDVLPFAYVLDLAAVWSRKFENILNVFPYWYYDSKMQGQFAIPRFGRIFNSVEGGITVRGASGGGSGGGGGGMGGGGGGSW